jgi:hypothetical protein
LAGGLVVGRAFVRRPEHAVQCSTARLRHATRGARGLRPSATRRGRAALADARRRRGSRGSSGAREAWVAGASARY